MDYTSLATTANALLKSVGFAVVVNRAGTSIGSGYGAFVSGKTRNEKTSNSALLAQTAVTTRTLLFSGLANEPMIGDILNADAESWMVQGVEKVRPSNVTLLYKLDVQ